MIMNKLSIQFLSFIHHLKHYLRQKNVNNTYWNGMQLVQYKIR